MLAAFNFCLCRELFRTEYLDNFQSNEGILVTLAKFFAHHPGARWYPLWNIGLPVENTYDPVVPVLLALFSSVTSISLPLALHILCGLFFCLLPVAWFWLIWKWGAPAECAFAAGLLYSLISPSLVPIRGLPGLLEYRRLLDVAFYGDIAHMVAVGFLPLALFAMERAARTARTRYFLAAILFSALTGMSDHFGITALALSTLVLAASLDTAEIPKAALRIGAIGAATYLCVCRILTPTLLRIISKNSQLLGKDYRFSKLTLAGWAIVLAGAAAIRFLTARRSFIVRFACLMAWTFCAIYAVYFGLNIPVLPVTERYDMEVDLAVSILAAIGAWQLPVRFRRALLVLALAAAVPQAIAIRRNGLTYLKPADLAHSAAFQGSRWIAANLPGVRIMAGGDPTSWFDYWTDNPQLSGGHDGLAPNFMQQVAVFTVYTDQNAGDRAAFYSIFWMKAFGVGAIYVPGPDCTDKIHPYTHPRKFDGVLPVLWKYGDAAIYDSTVRSRSLAHLIPASAVVAKRPMHGLDTAPAEAYVQALDNLSPSPPAIRWESPDRIEIEANFAPAQVLSVQATFDRGWKASSQGHRLTVRPDGLGMIVIEPRRPGPAEITLEFTGGPERNLLLCISLATILGLLLVGAVSLARFRPRTRQS